MDDAKRRRMRELLFFVVPDPDEDIDDGVLARTEAIDWEEGEQLKAEFRSMIEGLSDYEEVRCQVLESLDAIKASGNEARGDDVEWLNVCDVHGRRIRKALGEIL